MASVHAHRETTCNGEIVSWPHRRLKNAESDYSTLASLIRKVVANYGERAVIIAANA
ncbi:MAG: hypothetical protein QOF03_1331 [Alphaproteobacteria bacterium]|nr:hypothetical protein [Alphaproteobacteria bacterium]